MLFFGRSRKGRIALDKCWRLWLVSQSLGSFGASGMGEPISTCARRCSCSWPWVGLQQVTDAELRTYIICVPMATFGFRLGQVQAVREVHQHWDMFTPNLYPTSLPGQMVLLLGYRSTDMLCITNKHGGGQENMVLACGAIGGGGSRAKTRWAWIAA